MAAGKEKSLPECNGHICFERSSTLSCPQRGYIIGPRVWPPGSRVACYEQGYSGLMPTIPVTQSTHHLADIFSFLSDPSLSLVGCARVDCCLSHQTVGFVMAKPVSVFLFFFFFFGSIINIFNFQKSLEKSFSKL